MKRHSSRRIGFTLVELLVVIAIIGILVAMLLPAVQGARESGRRLQCLNQLTQMGKAVNTHLSSMTYYPTGGTIPWSNYVISISGDRVNRASRQSVGWAFQLLPYLEQDALYNTSGTPGARLTTVQNIAPGFTFCPSRRTVTRNGNCVLMDYAAACPGTDLWQSGDAFTMPTGKQYDGTIVRSDWLLDTTDTSTQTLGTSATSTPPITSGQMDDGTSNTLLIGEKRLNPANYLSGDWHDDRGWTDGWDPDIMRLTSNSPSQDGSDTTGYEFGAAHSGGFNVVFADGSTRMLEYAIDPTVLDLLGNRHDHKVIDSSKLGGE